MLPAIYRATSCLCLIRVLELRLTVPFLDYADNDEVGEVAARARRYSHLGCSESLMAGCCGRMVVDECSLCNRVLQSHLGNKLCT
jgi:hypothetical protein